MNKNLMKTLGIGMAVGGTALAMGGAMMRKSSKRPTKKSIAKAMKAVGNLVDDAREMLK